MARPKKVRTTEPDKETFEPSPAPILVGWENWPQIAEAATMLGYSERTLLRKVLRSEVPRVMCPDKIWRYRPTDLEDILLSSEDDEAKPSLEPVQRAVSAQIIEQQNRGLAQAYRHIEQLLSLVTGPQQLLIRHLSHHAERANAQNDKLQDKLLEGIELREAMLSEQNEREIEASIARASEARKDQALEFLRTTIAPALLQGLAKNSKASELQEFAKGLDPTTLEFLFSPENPLLSDAQRKQLASILEYQPQPQPVNTEGSPAPST